MCFYWLYHCWMLIAMHGSRTLIVWGTRGSLSGARVNDVCWARCLRSCLSCCVVMKPAMCRPGISYSFLRLFSYYAINPLGGCVFKCYLPLYSRFHMAVWSVILACALDRLVNPPTHLLADPSSRMGGPCESAPTTHDGSPDRQPNAGPNGGPNDGPTVYVTLHDLFMT